MIVFNIFRKKEKVDPARLIKYTETQLYIAFMRGAITGFKDASDKKDTTEEAFIELKNEFEINQKS